MPPKRRRIAASDDRSITNPSTTTTSPDTTVHPISDNSPPHSESPWSTNEENSSPQNTNNTDTSVNPSGSSRKRSEPVKSACGQCQKRKTKCSGQRPICGFCSDRGLECSWEIGDGLTRNADLRQRLTDANLHASDINTLVHDMRTNSDAVATTLLAKLRLGDSIQDLATGIREGTSMISNGANIQRKMSSTQSSER